MQLTIPANFFKVLDLYLANDQAYQRSVYLCCGEDPKSIVLTASDGSSAFEWTLTYLDGHDFTGLDMLLNYPKFLAKVKKGYYDIDSDDLSMLKHIDGNTTTRHALDLDSTTLPKDVHNAVFPKIFERLGPLAPGATLPADLLHFDWKALGFNVHDAPGYVRFMGVAKQALAFKVPRFDIGMCGVRSAKGRVLQMMYHVSEEYADKED